MVKIVLFSVKQENFFSRIKGPMGVCSGLKELSEAKRNEGLKETE